MAPCRRFVIAGALWLAAAVTGSAARADAAPPATIDPPQGSRLALALLEAEAPAGRSPRRVRVVPRLGAERASILLRSLTVPGWGQASVGRRGAAKVFLIAETGIWTSFTAFRVQEQLRRLTYERTARLFARIDVRGRNEEFRRIVGLYESSDEYNRLVVRRDAANLYYGDPEAYQAYIAEHELKGADTWAWDSDESQLRYRTERKRTERAALRANAALGVAIANRILSAIHVARYAGHPTTTSQSWNLECVPVLGDPVAFHLGVRTRF